MEEQLESGATEKASGNSQNGETGLNNSNIRTLSGQSMAEASAKPCDTIQPVYIGTDSDRQVSNKIDAGLDITYGQAVKNTSGILDMHRLAVDDRSVGRETRNSVTSFVPLAANG